MKMKLNTMTWVTIINLFLVLLFCGLRWTTYAVFTLPSFFAALKLIKYYTTDDIKKKQGKKLLLTITILILIMVSVVLIKTEVLKEAEEKFMILKEEKITDNLKLELEEKIKDKRMDPENRRRRVKDVGEVINIITNLEDPKYQSYRWYNTEWITIKAGDYWHTSSYVYSTAGENDKINFTVVSGAYGGEITEIIINNERVYKK